MKREDVIEILKGYKQRLDASCSNQLDVDKEAFEFAINAVETGEIYMTGEDYNLFLEGYKQGKKDFGRPQGQWIVEKNQFGDILHCSICGARPRRSEYGYDLHDKFCNECGADMRGKEE